MTDQDTAKRAVELAKDEIARLRADVFGLRTALEQQQRATEAERAARAIADADNAGLLTILREIDLTCSRPGRIQVLLEQARESEHPGRAIMGKALAELDAARAVIAVVRWAVENHYAPPPLCDALAVYDKATKARTE